MVTPADPRAWSRPLSLPPAASGTIVLWRAALSSDGRRLERFAATLTPDEHLRAERFKFAEHRAAFIAGRGILRAILARHLGCAPAAIRLVYGARGKPALDPAWTAARLSYNLSHSHGLALVAVGDGRDLGVDVERIRDGAVDWRLAERFFAAAEVAALRALPATEQVRGFYTCWSRKEAYVKARGDGLSLALDAFAVTVDGGEPGRLLSTGADPQEAVRWVFFTPPPIADYAAAVVAAAGATGMVAWEWEE